MDLPALLLLIGAVHYAVEPPASQPPTQPRASRALFYVAQGIKGICLFGLIAFLAPRKLTAIPLYLACLWGAAEDTLVAGCRIARGIETPLDLGSGRAFALGGPPISSALSSALLQPGPCFGSLTMQAVTRASQVKQKSQRLSWGC